MCAGVPAAAASRTQTIKPCLTELAEDPDVDVRFYAKQALHTADNISNISMA